MNLWIPLLTGDRALTVTGLSFGVLALSELFKLFTRKKRTGCEYIRYNTSGKGVSTDAFAVTYKT